MLECKKGYFMHLNMVSFLYFAYFLVQVHCAHIYLCIKLQIKNYLACALYCDLELQINILVHAYIYTIYDAYMHACTVLQL